MAIGGTILTAAKGNCQICKRNLLTAPKNGIIAHIQIERNMVNDLKPVEQKQEEQNGRIIRLLEQQLAQSNRQIEALTEQVRQLKKP